MTQAKPAVWHNSRYERKENHTWRNNRSGAVYNKKEGGKIIGYELNRSSGYGPNTLSKQKAKQAVKLFHQEKSEYLRAYRRPWEACRQTKKTF